MNRYPQLVFNINAICNNANLIYSKCEENNVEFTAVVKGIDTIPQIVLSIINSKINSYADSRIQKIRQIKSILPNKTSILIRIPMKSEIEDVIRFADISFNSELSIIKALNQEALRQNKSHKVILMADMGDLREGFFYFKDLLNAADVVYNSSNLILVGIATNLGCYGAVKPSLVNLNKLVEYARLIENKLNIKLDIVSGGGTSTLPLMLEGKLPKGITHLRCGEAITACKELENIWGISIDGLCKDAIYIEGEVIEIKDKPSYPVGEMVLDAFGNKPKFTDIGIRKKALVAIGKKDIGDHGYICPFSPNIKILGSSSDHLILDITDESTLEVGSIIRFHVDYGAMLYASGCDCVYKTYI